MENRVVGFVGRKFVIYIKDKDTFAMYDRESDMYIDDFLIDQNRIARILTKSDEESKEILKML